MKFIVADIDGQSKIVAHSSGKPREFFSTKAASNFIRNHLAHFDSARVIDALGNNSRRLRIN